MSRLHYTDNAPNGLFHGGGSFLEALPGQDIPLPSRQSMYVLISFKHKDKIDFYSRRGIFQQLTRQDWREIAERFPFQCDIFGKLPLEVASLAENLPLIDIIRLRVVYLNGLCKHCIHREADIYA